jgi:hypothetical protein
MTLILAVTQSEPTADSLVLASGISRLWLTYELLSRPRSAAAHAASTIDRNQSVRNQPQPMTPRGRSARSLGHTATSLRR